MAQTVTQNLPPVPSAMMLVDKGEMVTQPWQQWFVNLRDKVNQINAVVVAISGAGTPLAAFNALSPLTTNGDMLTYNSGNNIRLPIGTNGQILAVVSGLPAWVNPSAGSSPLTTKGDLYTHDATNNARLPVGTDGYTLVADSTQTLGIKWAPAGSASIPLTTKGDILGYDTAPNRIPVGTNGQTLQADSTQALGVKWVTVASYSPPVTTKGDLFGYSTIPTRIPVGTNGQALLADSTQTTGVRWGTPPSAMQLVATSTVTGSAVTSFTVSSLNLSSDSSYLIQLSLTNATGSTIIAYLTYNGDNTQSNYNTQVFFIGGSSSSAATFNDSRITEVDGSAQTNAKIDIWADVSGKPRAISYSNRGPVYIEQINHIWNSTANVTSITITSSASNGLGVGSMIKIFKLG